MKRYDLPALLAALSTATMLQVSPTWAAPADVVSGTAGHYRDGVFTATGNYGGQPSFLTVTITLEHDIVKDVVVGTHAYVPRSLELQRAFAAAVPQVVIGRPLDQVKVGKLAGSSGTPDGFNDAIRQIKEQARRN